jgi:hypothetical protein
MQRVRMSLPYFKEFGWEAEVVCVDEKYSEMVKDELLLQSFPADVVIHKVKALSEKWSRKIGFGSLGFRSMWYYRRKVNSLLIQKKYDLIYFSTTQFPVCILGAYWKKRFGVPYVIDMQDPWYSDYYEDKPKGERPPKYKLVYALHKRMEALAMKRVDGLISVSATYLQTLHRRYRRTLHIPGEIITFGAFEKDFEIAKQNEIKPLASEKPFFNCMYIGRGGKDMESAVALIFEGFKEGLSSSPLLFDKFRFHFFGTSYANNGRPSILPIAEKLGIAIYVNEQTDRLPFYQSIATLLAAEALIIPGSDSPGYTASKIYPYIMAQKPLLAVFHQDSPAVKILRECSPGSGVLTFPGDPDAVRKIRDILKNWAENEPAANPYDVDVFHNFSAREMTGKQVAVFNSVLTRP